MFGRRNGHIKIDWRVIGLLCLIFAPRLLSPAVFLTADEVLFLDHARDFAQGVSTGDWSRTLGIGYPGVTVAGWSAPAVAGAQTELAAYAAGRLMTALVTGLLLVIMVRLGRLLVGRRPALAAVGLLALDPYTLGYSRLFHIAAPLALFMTLAGLTGLLWLRNGRRSWLFLTGLFTGLALLTKSTALLLWPLLAILMVGWRLFRYGQARSSHFTEFVLRSVTALLTITVIAALVFFALWPAMWSQPLAALNLTFGKLLTDQEAGSGNLGLFWLGRFVEDPGPAFYPVVFLLKASPWLLVGLVLSAWGLLSQSAQSASRVSPLTARSLRPTLFSLWLFALTYLLVMTIASKKSIRYMLPAFPALYLLAGVAFHRLVISWKKRSLPALQPFRSSLPLALQLSLLFLLLLFTLFYHPYYFTYHNPLLLGWRWAPETVLVGWGEGLDEAARYLNRQPEGVVSAWYEWLFPIFYKGPVEAVVPQENLLTADQAVLYLNQVQRDIPGPNIIHYFRARRQPEYTVRLAGIDYAWVYPGPVAGFEAKPVPQYPLAGEFGGEVRLLGYDLFSSTPTGQATAGHPLMVTFYWQVSSPPPAERFIYTRLVDEKGHIWASADSPPVMGLWPVARWQADMLIEDVQELPVPAGIPPGRYRLEAGMYDAASGQVLAAAGQPVGQGGGLLLGEVDVAWQPHRAEPGLTHRTDVRLGPDAHLVGYEAPPPRATTGDLLPVRLAWREAKPFFALGSVPNNYVLFEWRSVSQGDDSQAEQLEALPWPIEQWGRGALLLSQHDVLVPPSLEDGPYELAVSLHTGSDPAGQAFTLGTIEISSPPHRFELPAAALSPAGPARLAEDISLAGYELSAPASDAALPASLKLTLYWRTQDLIATRYNVFAQLLDANNGLVAQSDSFPAGGQRPTTGWAPGEIITDAHTLPLPADLPAGSYRLIAGLYDPLTGRRLPVVTGENGHDLSFSDAILITEVPWP